MVSIKCFIIKAVWLIVVIVLCFFVVASCPAMSCKPDYQLATGMSASTHDDMQNLLDYKISRLLIH
jgi:hypothetical protein